MFTATALTSAAEFGPMGHGVGGFGFLFLLIPLFWIAVIVVVGILVGRRVRRRGGWGGPGAGGWGGPWGGHHQWAQTQAARTAEATLADRFARGDIDEVEYRARLEVLRASIPQPPAPPTA